MEVVPPIGQEGPIKPYYPGTSNKVVNNQRICPNNAFILDMIGKIYYKEEDTTDQLMEGCDAPYEDGKLRRRLMEEYT